MANPKKAASLKLAPLYTYELVKKYSSPEMPILQKQLIALLKEEEDMEMNAKTMMANMKLLLDAGLIESDGKNKGYYFSEREFEEGEISLLAGSVLSSPFIGARQASDLIERLYGLLGRNYQPALNHLRALKDLHKSDNQELFLSIEYINDAIRRRSRVTFDYYRYDQSKNLSLRGSYEVTPYVMVAHHQHYYLMAYHEKDDAMVFFRIDRMKNVEVVPKRGKRLEEVPGFEKGVDYEYLFSALPYMYSDKAQRISMKIDEETVDAVIDWFGLNNVSIEEIKGEEDKLKVIVKSSPAAVCHWALQYLEHVEVLAPDSLRKRIREILSQNTEKYLQDK